MRGVSIQGMHQRRSRHNDPDPHVATTVDPSLVALRQAEPTLQIEIIPDPFIRLLPDEEAGRKLSITAAIEWRIGSSVRSN